VANEFAPTRSTSLYQGYHQATHYNISILIKNNIH